MTPGNHGNGGVERALRRRVQCQALQPASPLGHRLAGCWGVRVWAAGVGGREVAAGRLRSRRGAGVIELT